MKKLAIAISSATLMLGGLTACGGANDEALDTNNTTEFNNVGFQNDTNNDGPNGLTNGFRDMAYDEGGNDTGFLNVGDEGGEDTDVLPPDDENDLNEALDPTENTGEGGNDAGDELLGENNAGEELLEGEDNNNQQEGNEATPERFADVAEGTWYDNEVHWIREHGAMQGREDNEFAPDAPMTRAEIAELIQNLAQEGFLDIPTPTKEEEDADNNQANS